MTLMKKEFMKKLEICLSPALYPYHKLEDSIVVVIDIFRATSTFCVALANGVKSIVPIASAEETLAYKGREGYLTAGERNGLKLDGFDLSNSPFDFTNNAEVQGKHIAFTTTNGTQAIDLVKNDAQVVIGAFLNENALVDYLVAQQKNVVLLCSGWKNTINYEDTLFAASLSDKMLQKGVWHCQADSYTMIQALYEEAKANLQDYIYKKSDRVKKRAEDLGEEFAFCLQRDIFQNIPIFDKGHLVNYEA